MVSTLASTIPRISLQLFFSSNHFVRNAAWILLNLFRTVHSYMAKIFFSLFSFFPPFKYSEIVSIRVERRSTAFRSENGIWCYNPFSPHLFQQQTFLLTLLPLHISFSERILHDVISYDTLRKYCQYPVNRTFSSAVRRV